MLFRSRSGRPRLKNRGKIESTSSGVQRGCAVSGPESKQMTRRNWYQNRKGKGMARRKMKSMKPGLSRHSPDAVEPKPGQVEHIPTGTSVDIGRRPTGTREWSEHSANIYNGCGHNCRYCYAREMALRFKRKKLPADWPRMELIEKELTKRRRKLKGQIGRAHV